MRQNECIIYPNVDLFVYDLREDLRAGAEELKANRKLFWSRVYADTLSDERLKKLATRENPNAEYVELLGTTGIEVFDSVLESYCRPYQVLGDTYALQVNCSTAVHNQQNYAPQPLNCLKPIIEKIESRVLRNKPASLGETWLVWGQLSENNSDSLDVAKAIAQSCYIQLFPDGNSLTDPHSRGVVNGGDLFEVWQDTNSSSQPGSGFHLLIWLFPFTDSMEHIKNCTENSYFPLMRLFAYRSKIFWAINQCLDLEASLKNDFKQIQVIVEQLSQFRGKKELHDSSLNHLQEFLIQSLNMLYRYTGNLNLLNSQLLTIKTNIDNYEKRLQLIETRYGMEGIDPKTDFSKHFAQKQYWQIQSNYDNLRSGLVLIESLISTITGITEISQAVEDRKHNEKDRKLNDTIAIFGIGLATSQIASSVLVSQYPPDAKIWFICTQAFLLSVLAGVVSGFVIWLVFWLLRRL